MESEETGFSAVEEEVKSNQMINRPTVYAGMSGKMEKSTMHDSDNVYNELIHQYVDNSIDQGISINS